MPATLSNGGGFASSTRSATTLAQPRRFADVLDEAYLEAVDADDTNQTSYAHKLGVEESTLRRWKEGRSEPGIDRVKEIADRDPALKVRVLVYLAGGDFAIVPVEIPAGLSPLDQAAKLRELAHQTSIDLMDARRVLDNAMADGRIDGAEEADFTAATTKVHNSTSALASAVAAFSRFFRRR